MCFKSSKWILKKLTRLSIKENDQLEIYEQ